MKLRALVLAVIVIACTAVMSCTPAKSAGRVAIDSALAICAAENTDKSAEEVALLCGAAESLLPFLRDLLAAQRRGAVKVGAPPPKGS